MKDVCSNFIFCSPLTLVLLFISLLNAARAQKMCCADRFSEEMLWNGDKKGTINSIRSINSILRLLLRGTLRVVSD